MGRLAVNMISLSPPRPQATAREPVAEPGSSTGFYRYDLDGLRGIAIALVAIFHIWFGRVSGGVDVFLALSGFFFGGKLLRAALDPHSISVADLRGDPAGPSAGSRAGRGPGRVRGADHPGAAADPLGDLRRPEPGQPGLLPELGAGQHGVQLPAGGRGRQPVAAHLVHVGAGPVLHRVPAAGHRVRLPAAPPIAAPAPAHRVRGPAERADGGFVRLRDLRPPGRPGQRVLQQLRAGLGVAAGRARRRAGAPHPLADVAAHRARHRRAGGGAVLRGPDRRRPAIPRPVGAGSRRGRDADDPGRGQPWRAEAPATGCRRPTGCWRPRRW